MRKAYIKTRRKKLHVLYTQILDIHARDFVV